MNNKPDLSKEYLWMSAFQKAVRRGQEEDALFWALQLIYHHNLLGNAGRTMVWNRLRVMASEDVGSANPEACVVIHSLAESDAKLNKNKQDKPNGKGNGGRTTDIFVSHAVLYLCRSAKNREVDDFICHMYGKIREGWKATVPDYAYDKHTAEGRKKGRRFKHFYDGDKEDHSDSPTRLENVKGESKYFESARKYDLASEKKAK